MKCPKCNHYTPGYYCAHCKKPREPGEMKPLDKALEELHKLQSLNRVHRPGQKETHVHYISGDEIDEHILKTLKDKKHDA